MNGVAPESLRGAAAQLSPGLSEGDVTRLQESFKVFNQVTRSLERAYSRLENRAAGVETRLQDANGRLRAKVSQLKTVTAELNGILDAIPCGVVACDKDGTITTMNPAAERILGRSRDEVRGRNAQALLDHRGRPILLAAKDDMRRGTIVERLVCCLDGGERYLSGSVADLPDGGLLEILSDQTEVAHLRSQVTRLDTLAELGEMAAGVAHEIRNPMSAVEGFAGLMEKALRDASEPADGEQLRRYADRVRKGVAEVNGIITNLLLWARPEPARMETVDVVLLINEVVTDVTSLGGSKSVADGVTVDVETVESFALSGDRLKLKLAVGNLVRNAVEAAESGGRVRVSTRRDAQWLQILVDDDGPGIAASVRARLFRPFTTNKPTGTGLGLALVRKFAELHGGSVATAPCPLGGARFVLSLPVRSGGAKE